MTPRILIVYGSKFGQTAKVAHRCRDLLVARGCDVAIWRGDELPAEVDLDDFDGVMIGASMIVQGYQRYIREFVVRHLDDVNTMPSMFFAVSGSAGSAIEKERAEAERLLATFCADTGWHPFLTASVAGAIAFTKYGMILRWVMKRIARKEGVSTDTSRDHEYTDWAQVERFTAAFFERVSAVVAAETAAGSV